MPPEMPTLGSSQKKTPIAPIAIAATLFGLIAGGVFWMTHREAAVEVAADAKPDAGVELAQAAPTEPAPTTPVPTEPTAPAPTVAVAPAAPAPTSPTPAPVVAAKEDKGGLKHFSVIIHGPLEGAITEEIGKEVGAPLTQVVNRSLVWWLKVPNDVLKNDTLAVVYEERDGQEPLVHAVRYASRKFGKTFEAYRFRAPNADFARFYQADGSELEERLVGGPIDTYEQITSLLRDGRKHKGVDFKAPVGTPVKATFDGTITRRNWNFRGNGNSLELEESGGDGRTAMYLHLSELPKTVKVGDRVKKGQVLAQSGNTGHSFAPHLHYQLMKGDKVIDPFTSHSTRRDSISSELRPALDAEVARLRSLLPVVQLAGK